MIGCHLTAGGPNYGDEKIQSLLKDYFKSASDAPQLLGQRFYADRDDIIFQIDIDVEIAQVHAGIIFGFEAITKIAPLSKRDFSFGILILHFDGNHLPVVAISDIECSKEFFIEKNMKEEAWRKHCLLIEDKDG